MSTAIEGNPVDQIMAMLVESGQRSYGGEAVNQLEHALQAAMLAEDLGMDEEFVVACLLHDVGHLTPEAQEVFDDAAADESQRKQEGANHGAAGAHFLDDLISDRMAWLIEHHATAKRYLCAVEPGYYDRLSPVSKQTLAYQGGPMTPEEVEEIRDHPWLDDLITLRRFDDEAKIAGRPTPTLEHYRPMLERQLRPRTPEQR